MSASKYDIKLDQGSDYSITLTLKDNQSNNLDLTGYTFEGQIRPYVTSQTVLADFVFEILNQALPETKGKVRIKLPASSSSAITLTQSTTTTDRISSKFIYDIESTSPAPDSIVKRIIQGTVTISPEVTRG